MHCEWMRSHRLSCILESRACHHQRNIEVSAISQIFSRTAERKRKLQSRASSFKVDTRIGSLGRLVRIAETTLIECRSSPANRKRLSSYISRTNCRPTPSTSDDNLDLTLADLIAEANRIAAYCKQAEEVLTNRGL
jgi:hypothetical protein